MEKPARQSNFRRRRGIAVGAIVLALSLLTWLLLGPSSSVLPVQDTLPPAAESFAPIEPTEKSAEPTAASSVKSEANVSQPTPVSQPQLPKPFNVGASMSIFQLIQDAMRFVNRNLNVHPTLPDPTFTVKPANVLIAGLCADKDPLDAAIVDRRIATTEFERCRKSRKRITEIKIGYQAVSLVRSRLYDAPKLTTQSIFLALAREVPDPAHPDALIRNPNVTWNQIDSTLAAERIDVSGPPMSSSVGITFLDLIMKPGCASIPSLALLKDRDPDRFEVVCRSVRDDGVYQLKQLAESADSNPFNFVGYLQSNPNAMALLGFREEIAWEPSFSTIAINNVVPTRSSIYSGEYVGGRVLYLYANPSVPHMREFVFAIWSSVGGVTGDPALVTVDPSEQQSLRRQVSALPDLQF